MDWTGKRKEDKRNVGRGQNGNNRKKTNKLNQSHTALVSLTTGQFLVSKSAVPHVCVEYIKGLVCRETQRLKRRNERHRHTEKQ